MQSPSITTRAVRGPAQGDDLGRKPWGRKRHGRVATQGNRLEITVTGAEQSAQGGGLSLREPLKEWLPRRRWLWGDSHDGGPCRTWTRIPLGWTIQTITARTVPKRGRLVQEGEEVDGEKHFPPGFRPQPGRWVVERPCSGIVRWRQLCRDHEGLPRSREAVLTIAMGCRMLDILTPPHLSY
jgi:putative transposase